MTLKQRNFVKKYIEFGNATEAAEQVYNARNRKVASQIGYENLRKHDVISAIEEYFVREDLSPLLIAGKLKDMLNNGTPSQQLRVCELYFKLNGLI